MESLRELIDAVKIEQEERTDIPTGIERCIEKNAVWNASEDLKNFIIKRFETSINKGNKYQDFMDSYVKKDMCKYYSELPFEIEILEKKELKNNMTGYIYKIQFADGSFYQRLYVWDQRMTYLTFNELNDKFMVAIEDKLIENGIPLANKENYCLWMQTL